MTKKIPIFLILVILLAGLAVIKQIKAGADDNVYGWAWSENIGWISMNRTNFEHWTLVDDPVGEPDDFDTYVWTDSIIEEEDVYELTDPGPELGAISQVRIHARFMGKIKGYFRLNRINSPLSPEVGASGNWSDQDIGWFPNSPDGTDWEWDDLTNLQIGISLKGYTIPIIGLFQLGELTQVYVEVDYGGAEPLILRPNGTGDYTNIANPPPLAGADYGVHICQSDTDPNPKCAGAAAPKQGKFVGYAWTDTIGWIQFNPAPDFAAYPGCGYPDASCYSACLDLPGAGQICDGIGDWKVAGWARASAGIGSPGGWDGWIRLRGTWGNRLLLNTTFSPAQFEGWAWGGNDNDEEAVIGWISFNCSNQGVCGTSPYKVMTDMVINSPPSAININVAEGNYCFLASPPVLLNWTFDDDDPGDTQSAYQIQVDDSGAGFPSPEVDTGQVATAGPGPDYSYAPVGLSFGVQYWWRLKVWDSAGADSGWIDGGSFTTDPEWPEPDFVQCPSTPEIEQTVQFCSVYQANVCELGFCSDMTLGNDLTVCNGAACSVWDWDFGDGSGTSNEQNPVYFYPNSGTYTVSLTVTDVNGNACPRTHDLKIRLPLPEWREIAPF